MEYGHEIFRGDIVHQKASFDTKTRCVAWILQNRVNTLLLARTPQSCTRTTHSENPMHGRTKLKRVCYWTYQTLLPRRHEHYGLSQRSLRFVHVQTERAAYNSQRTSTWKSSQYTVQHGTRFCISKVHASGELTKKLDYGNVNLLTLSHHMVRVQVVGWNLSAGVLFLGSPVSQRIGRSCYCNIIASPSETHLTNEA